MNRPLRRVALACLVMFGLLLVNVNYLQVVRAGELRDDPRNSRTLTRAYERERGPIAVGTGQERLAVARSTEVDGPLRWLRQYPGGPAYAHVTGFYSLVYGRTGIERAQDSVLSGEDPRLFVRRLSDYVTGREPAGGAIALTLSDAAQQAAFSGLGGNRGSVVALDPRTGAVLAMVSTPSYDPSRLSSFTPADIRQYYAELSEGAGDPLLNRAIARTYPPGSTFKMVTAAAAIESGDFTQDTRVPSPRELPLPQTTQPLRNFGGAACSGETSTIAEAMRISCNTAFGHLGLELSAEQMLEQARAFGFGDDSLQVPTRVAPSVFPAEPNAPQRAQSAIGQFEVRTTPLQMAMVAAGIANGGDVMRPYLVREIQAPDLSRLDLAEPEVLSTAVQPGTADQLSSMMELVVSSGSGRNAQIPGVRVAGKTGTAQHAPGRAPHAWFIGFAPAEDPQVAVAVVIEEGGTTGAGATGGALSAPIARDVMRAVLGQ